MVLGQDVTFQASSKTSVRAGEQFRVTYTLNTRGSQYKGPSFEGFRILSGPMSSTNQSYQIINGKVEQSYQQTYTYYLRAADEGDFTIDPASIRVDGKEYNSNPLKINVTKGTTTSSGGSQQQQSDPQTGLSSDDVFIRASISKTSPYQGEQVMITYRIYTTVPISQISINKLSSFPGLWYKDLLEDNQALKQSNETINGKEYVVATLRKIALFPQRSGEIVIEPMELECLAQVRTQSNSRFRDPFFDSFFDDPFFNRNVRNVPLQLSSNQVKLNVKALPLQGKPTDFKGAVGQFTLTGSLDKNEVTANDAITLRVKIAGKGNLELIDPLDFNFPPDFEVYDPKITNNITRDLSGISGSRTYEYLIIPRNAGEFKINPTPFVYFDHAKDQYFRLTTPEYTISVARGAETESQVTYSGVNQKDIQYIGSDIRHIKSYPFELLRVGTYFYRSQLFYILLIGPVVLFFATLLLWQAQAKRSRNTVLVKNRKANRVAKKNLKQAKIYLGQNEENKFFEEVSRALWGYLSNKFNIAFSELSMDTVNDRLRRKKVSEDTINEFTTVLNNCEYARFAPASSSDRMNDIYGQALDIISKTEREIK
jgi:hypothetical protein